MSARRLDVNARLNLFGFEASDLGLEALPLPLQLRHVDSGQCLLGIDVGADIDFQLFEITGNSRIDLGLVVGMDGGWLRAGAADLLRDRLDDLHGRPVSAAGRVGCTAWMVGPE